MKTSILLSTLLLASVAIAQESAPPTPAIDPNFQNTNTPSKYPVEAPPPVNLLANKDIDLTPSEIRNLTASRRAAELGAQGESGELSFRFGGGVPTVVCSPLYVCDIELQPGELVNNVLLGDRVRWILRPAVTGEGQVRTHHIVVKPTDIGLTTNLLVTTTRRSYSILLRSHATEYMPKVSFSYPEDELAEFQRVASATAAQNAATILPTTRANVLELDFGFIMSGKARWRPARVYTDGVKTYIEFPASMAADEAPALLAIGDDKAEQLVNYRVKGLVYVVDRVLERAVLVSGVGRSQTRVLIERGAQ